MALLTALASCQHQAYRLPLSECTHPSIWLLPGVRRVIGPCHSWWSAGGGVVKYDWIDDDKGQRWCDERDRLYT